VVAPELEPDPELLVAFSLDELPFDEDDPDEDDPDPDELDESDDDESDEDEESVDFAPDDDEAFDPRLSVL
jgi:hypothetical protein